MRRNCRISGLQQDPGQDVWIRSPSSPVFRAEGIARLQQGSRGGHELHQAVGALGRYGTGPKGEFFARDLTEQQRIDVPTAGCPVD